MRSEEWLKRCANRLKELAKLSDDEASDMANALLDGLDGDTTEDPEVVADDELSHLTD